MIREGSTVIAVSCEITGKRFGSNSKMRKLIKNKTPMRATSVQRNRRDGGVVGAGGYSWDIGDIRLVHTQKEPDPKPFKFNIKEIDFG